MRSDLTAGPRSDDAAPSRDDEDDAVTFTLLGPLEVHRHGHNHAPSAPKVLQLLALLLMRPAKVVQVDSIVRELWGDTLPRSVRTTMLTYVYQLRKGFERSGLAADGGTLVVTRSPGYLLRVDPAQLDVTRFQTLCARGQESMAAHRHHDA